GPAGALAADHHAASGAPAFAPHQPGIYRIGPSSDAETFVVNATSVEETVDVSRFAAASTKAVSLPNAWELSKPLLLLALILLCAETWRHVRAAQGAVMHRSLLSQVGQYIPRAATAAVVLIAMLDVDLPRWTDA